MTPEGRDAGVRGQSRRMINADATLKVTRSAAAIGAFARSSRMRCGSGTESWVISERARTNVPATTVKMDTATHVSTYAIVAPRRLSPARLRASVARNPDPIASTHRGMTVDIRIPMPNGRNTANPHPTARATTGGTHAARHAGSAGAVPPTRAVLTVPS